jgi:hypothetical protein
MARMKNGAQERRLKTANARENGRLRNANKNPGSRSFRDACAMGWLMGLEPTALRATT